MPDYHKELEVHFFRSCEEWTRWLDRHFAQQESIWIKLAKKHSGLTSITYEQARETALIYGWIDGLINRWEAPFYLIKFTHRRKRSNWSRINRTIAESLIESGRMHPNGLKQVLAAKQDGRWEAAYDSAATMEIPAELKAFLKSNRDARLFFESINRQNQYAFLYRIQTAKRPETRQRHLDKTFQMLRDGKVYHPVVRKKK